MERQSGKVYRKTRKKKSDAEMTRHEMGKQRKRKSNGEDGVTHNHNS
jgi:hypothetical protein